jgi:hypothetical protein
MLLARSLSYVTLRKFTFLTSHAHMMIFLDLASGFHMSSIAEINMTLNVNAFWKWTGLGEGKRVPLTGHGGP